MREACHEAIAEHLDTEPAVHEVRHQKSECHTDLVYCELDADGVAARREMTTGTAPLHDPLQRFKVWWYVNEYGPKGRQEVVTTGNTQTTRRTGHTSSGCSNTATSRRRRRAWLRQWRHPRSGRSTPSN